MAEIEDVDHSGLVHEEDMYQLEYDVAEERESGSEEAGTTPESSDAYNLKKGRAIQLQTVGNRRRISAFLASKPEDGGFEWVQWKALLYVRIW